jgi:hypothetical protein
VDFALRRALFPHAMTGPARNPPRQILVRIPWFFELAAAEANGQRLEVQSGHVVVPPGTAEVKLRGCIRADAPRLSYDQAVADYKAEYRRRHEEFLRTGLK